MIRLIHSAIILTATILFQPIEKTGVYRVKQIGDAELVVTGKGDSPLWGKANELSDFIYPWETLIPPQTSFKALHNSNWVYCLYRVQDPNVHVYVNTNDKSEVVYSDRVEIFFRKDEKLAPYYGLELDANGRIYDYEATYRRNFNDKWSWPKGQLIVKAARTGDGYIVEVAIRKASLRELGLLNGNKLEAGLFRAECLKLDHKDESNIRWISWIKPDSKTPDFHIPSAFGVLLLEE